MASIPGRPVKEATRQDDGPARKPRRVAPKYETWPPAVAEVQGALWFDVFRLQYLVLTFRELFREDPKIQLLLDEYAVGFFALTFHVFFESMIGSVCRLLDPLKSAGRANLVLESLCRPIAADGRKAVADTIRVMVDEARKSSAPLLVYRHKRIAHTDYDVRTEYVKLERVGIAQLDTVLTQVYAIVNRVEREYGRRITNFPALTQATGARKLVTALGLLDRYRRSDPSLPTGPAAADSRAPGRD